MDIHCLLPRLLLVNMPPAGRPPKMHITTIKHLSICTDTVVFVQALYLLGHSVVVTSHVMVSKMKLRQALTSSERSYKNRFMIMTSSLRVTTTVL